MPAFDFKGLDKSGKEISGVRDADNEKALRTLLKGEGVFITRIGKGPRKGQSLLATEVDVAQYFERITAMLQVDLEALYAARPQPCLAHLDGEGRSAGDRSAGFVLFRLGDGVAPRNVHAAIYDALRLCKDV